MKLPRLFPIAILLGILLLSSCVTIYSPSSSSNAGQSEPLAGEWQMTRLSITPPLPVPDIIINQVISDKATWKISRQGSQLAISYDGRDTWYKSIVGLNIEKKKTVVTESPAKTSAAVTGGGSVNLDKLPFFLSAISSQKIEQINVGFDDKVQVNLASSGKLNASIAVNVNGKYYGETEFGGTMKLKTLQQNLTIAYEGVKK